MSAARPADAAPLPAARARAAAGRRVARGFGHAEVFALLFAASFAVARWAPVLALPYACPFRALTGIPCATCGMTHAFVHLAHGAVAASLAASPLGAAGAALGWAFAAIAAARLAAGLPWPRIPARAPRLLALAAVGALLANWAFLVVAHRA